MSIYDKLADLMRTYTDIDSISDEEVLDRLTTPSITVISPSLTSIRGLMGALGPIVADEIMTGLEAAANVDSVVARVVHLMQPSEGGVDLGNVYTRASIDNLALAGILTNEQASALKAIAETLVTPLEEAGIGSVTLGDVEFARSML